MSFLSGERGCSPETRERLYNRRGSTWGRLLIHYHGGPITPEYAAVRVWSRRHGMVSFAEQRQVELAAEVCQSFALDNGAFSAWKQGSKPDWPAFEAWVDEWRLHPGFDFAVIPDDIEGDEKANDALLSRWAGVAQNSVPVWHMHESTDRLRRLVAGWPRVALGSSGAYAEVGTEAWWRRMAEAMEAACDEQGRPLSKLHGLRMLNPTIFSRLPLASADSTSVARNIGIDQKWKGTYQAMSKETRALILAERIEFHASAARWSGDVWTQENLELVG